VKLSDLRQRDLAATFLVLVGAAYYGLFEAGVRVPDIGSARAVAAVVFFLGVTACATGADQGLFRAAAAVSVVVRAQMALGAAAFVVGLLAVTLGSEPMLTALFAIIMTLWLSATLRHTLRRPAPPSVAYPQRRPDFVSNGR